MKNVLKKVGVPFTMVSNELLNSKIITLKAKGLYSYMYSKPDNWSFTILGIAKQSFEGKDAIQAAILELKKHGWIKYQRFSNGTGVYTLYYEPQTDKPLLVIPEDKAPSAKSASAKSASAKPARINKKENLNKKEEIKKTIYKENFSFSDFKKEFVKDEFLKPLQDKFGLTHEKMKILLAEFLFDVEAAGDWEAKKMHEIKRHFINILKKQSPEIAQKSIQFKRYNLEEVEAIKAADPLAIFVKIFIKGKPVFITEEDFRRYNAEHRFLTSQPQKTA